MGMFFSVFSYADTSETVWIDVRSIQENKIDSIQGDPLIPYTKIVRGVKKLSIDKNTKIRLYCRSGQRAGVALSALKKAGYNNVENIGSIGNARKKRGLSQ